MTAAVSALHGGPGARALWTTMATLAVAGPALLAYNRPPSATLLNQVLALAGWAGFVVVVAAALPVQPRLLREGAAHGLRALVAALVLLALAALAAPLWTGQPWSLARSSAGLIGAAVLVALGGAAAQRAGRGVEAFRAFAFALVVAGVASAAIGFVQMFAPQWTGSHWIAQSLTEGRAVGNLRQPNHLSSLLLWAIVAAVWLGEAGAMPRRVAAASALVMLYATVLTGSRTGGLGVLLIAAWGLLDRGLARRTRGVLLAMPVLYVLAWAGMTFWSHEAHQTFFGEAQINKSDLSSSRFGIWANTLVLILQHPWAGVGFGEFNFAWTLTPFPGRPVAFFDHTHNLVLNFAVELGLPLAAVVIALLLVALVRAWRAAAASDAAASPLRAALVVVLLAALHSQLEYPLWYAYFLLPTAFAFGLCGVGAPPDAALAAAPLQPERTRPLALLALWLALCCGLSLFDYGKVVVIFAPGDGAAPLAQRIADGRRSWFFAHHADYAAATTVEHPSQVMASFATSSHYLLDTRLMIAWARAFDEAGDAQRARFIAARLREFRNPDADEFFAPCDDPAVPAARRPFQCQAPTLAMDYRNFRP